MELLIVRLSLEDAARRAVAVEQLRWGKAKGLYLAGYGWSYWHENPIASALGWLEVAREADANLLFLAPDAEDIDPSLEPEQYVAWLENARSVLKAVVPLDLLYTGAWWLEQIGPAVAGLAGFGLWLANYDGIATLEWPGYGPWTKLLGKQYSNSAGRLDLNVFDPCVLGVA